MLSVKCSKCSAIMIFDDKRGIFTCPECNNSVAVTELDDPRLGSRRGASYDTDKALNNSVSNNNNNNNNNNEHHADSPVNAAQLESVPYTVSEKEAVKAYKRWSIHGIFSPKSYNTRYKNYGLSLKYIPCTVYSICVHASSDTICTIRNEQKSSKERQVITDYYNIYNETRNSYNEFISYEMCSSIERSIMENIGLYSFDSAKTADITAINSSALSGCSVTDIINDPNRRNKDENIKNIVINDTADTLNSLIKGYDSTYTDNTAIDAIIDDTRYILVPVWTFNTGDTPDAGSFYMNAQTGAIYGKCPVSIAKILVFTLFLGIVIFSLTVMMLYILGIIV